MALRWQQEIEDLITAIEVAEGGKEALVRAVRCSTPRGMAPEQWCADYAEAREMAWNTIVHLLWDLATDGTVESSDPETFVRRLGARWAPVGAANDPTGLNRNWVPNVLALWKVQR